MVIYLFWFYLLVIIIYFPLPLRVMYFCLECQWMLLAMFFILNSSIFSGLLNYLILNAIISITLIIGMLMCNSLLLNISCYGKVGYYPWFLVLSLLFYNSSYLFMLSDLINKWAYYSTFIVIFNTAIFHHHSEYWLILINLYIIIFYSRLINSIKHMMPISSYLLFMLMYLLINLNNYLFCYLFSLSYTYPNPMMTIKCNFYYVFNDLARSP